MTEVKCLLNRLGLAMICQRGQTERRGRKEVKREQKGDVVYLDGIERIDANSNSKKESKKRMNGTNE